MTLTSESGAQVPVRVIDNKDKTFRVEFSTDTVGTLTATVSYANQPVPKSPFKVTSVDVSKVIVKELPASKFLPDGVRSVIYSEHLPFNLCKHW